MEELPITNKPSNSVLKKIRKIIFWLFLLIVLFLTTLVSLIFIYESEVKSAIITELNKHLKAEVKIDPKNIDLTIIKTFPDCSIEFKNVLMLEALNIKKRDTLVFAHQLNLHFNIKDLWNKTYNIQKVKLKGGIVKLVVLKNGTNNYTFWKEDKSNVASDSIRFKLNKVTLENITLNYKDKQTAFKTELEIQSLNFKGNFNQASYDLSSDGKLDIKNITHQKNAFLKNKELNFSLELAVTNNHYTFKKANLNLNRLALNLSGNFFYTDSLENLKLRYTAPNIDIASVLSLLPEEYKNKINDYESSGNFYANGNIKYNHKNSYSIISSFGIKNGRVIYTPKSTELSNLNMEGKLNFTNKNSSLEIKNLYLQLNNDEIQGHCFIRNFSNPEIQLSTQANITLQNLQNFWPIDTLTTLSGNLKLKATVNGLLNDLKDKTLSTKVVLEIDAAVTNLEAQFKGDDKIYGVENCSITAKEREVTVHDLKLKRGVSDIKLNGKIPGLFNYLIDRNEPLIIYGNLFSNFIQLEDFMPKTTSTSQGNDNPLIPENVEFKLNAAILKFGFAKFEAQSITGDIEIKKQKAIISDMKLNTMEGEAEINVFADNSKEKLEVVLQSHLKNINVNQLFKQFNNFGQSTLEDKNIKGYATADIDFSGVWNNRLEANYKSIRASSNLNIVHGELINFKPLLSLSNYVDVRELQRIKFSTLQGHVEIKNELISIPKTSIKNSALNIEFFGTHSFNNDIDYHIQLLISELLAKKRKNKNEDFGPVENDLENRRSAFILMTGTVDNPIIKYDRKSLKEKIKTDIKQEKQNIRQILKEEFGLFKKDSLSKAGNKTEPTFELETPKATSPKKEVPPKKKEEEEDEDF